MDVGWMWGGCRVDVSFCVKSVKGTKTQAPASGGWNGTGLQSETIEVRD